MTLLNDLHDRLPRMYIGEVTPGGQIVIKVPLDEYTGQVIPNESTDKERAAGGDGPCFYDGSGDRTPQ